MVDAGVSLDAIHDGHVLEGRLPYRLVIVPEWAYLAPRVRRALKRFASQGGSLLVLGVAAARMFAREFGVRLGADTDETKRYACLETDDGARYLTGPSAAARRGLKSPIDRLLPDPGVERLTDAAVDVVARRRGRGLRVHLCNTSGARTTALAWDRIAPTGPLELSLRLPRAPKSVRLQPGNRALRWTRRAGRIHVAVPSIPLHAIVTVD